MKYYPIFVNLKGRTVLLVGGGSVALKKIPALLEAGARVRLVAPRVLKEIERLSQGGKLEWLNRAYEFSDLEGVTLVIAATDDEALQKRIVTEARQRKIWVNAIDSISLCDFIAPAVISRGALQIAISTGGASPALAKLLRQKVEPILGAEYADLVKLLQRYRPDILKLPRPRRDLLWKSIVSPVFLNQIKTQGAASAEIQLKKRIGHIEMESNHGKSAV